MQKLTNEQARVLVIATIRSILDFNSNGKIVYLLDWKSKREKVRRNIYELVKYKVHLILGLSEKTLFKRLSKKSNRSVYFLNIFRDAALVELRLRLKQGIIAADALAKLKDLATTDEERLSILRIAHRNRKNFETPTTTMIVDAFDLYIAKQSNT